MKIVYYVLKLCIYEQLSLHVYVCKKKKKENQLLTLRTTFTTCVCVQKEKENQLLTLPFNPNLQKWNCNWYCVFMRGAKIEIPQ